MASSSHRLYILAATLLVFGGIIVFAAVRYDLFWSPSVAELSGSRAASTLRFVTIFTRHGNRGPYDNYPSYPYCLNDTQTWPYGRLQLTRRGRTQMYELGKKFRSLYNGFLSQNYKREEVMAFSTQTDRTLMSAQLFLAGLYRPHGYQLWNKEILWQPVPVYPTYMDKLQLISDPTLCPVFDEARKKSEEEFNREYGAESAAIMKNIEPYTGEQIDYKNPLDVRKSMYLLWDTLLCAESEGLPLPEWTEQFYRQPMESMMAKIAVSVALATDDMIRLFEGLLFKEMIELMQDKVDGRLSPDRMMYLYFGHDYTILGLLGILGLCRGSVPLVVESGSGLIFELHQDPLNHLPYVQVLYIDGASSDLEPKEIYTAGCEFSCDFDLFKNITEKYYNIADWEGECSNTI